MTIQQSTLKLSEIHDTTMPSQRDIIFRERLAQLKVKIKAEKDARKAAQKGPLTPEANPPARFTPPLRMIPLNASPAIRSWQQVNSEVASSEPTEPIAQPRQVPHHVSCNLQSSEQTPDRWLT